MRKWLTLFFALALALTLFGAVSIASADDNLSGDWSGTWNCPGGEKTSGTMRGHIEQNGQNITGNCVMENTIKGTITGRLNGTASDGTFDATIMASEGGEIDIDGTYQGNTIKGSYLSGIGDGTFTLNKQ